MGSESPVTGTKPPNRSRIQPPKKPPKIEGLPYLNQFFGETPLLGYPSVLQGSCFTGLPGGFSIVVPLRLTPTTRADFNSMQAGPAPS